MLVPITFRSLHQTTAGHNPGDDTSLKEPDQEQAPAVVEAAGSFLPPTPPRDPPSQVVVVDLLPLHIINCNPISKWLLPLQGLEGG